MKIYGQREYMILLTTLFGYNRNKIIAKYARAERNGTVKRYSNPYRITPEYYARSLYSDGIHKGWLYKNLKKGH